MFSLFKKNLPSKTVFFPEYFFPRDFKITMFRCSAHIEAKADFELLEAFAKYYFHPFARSSSDL